MINLSRWANRHVVLARTILVSCHLLLTVLALVTGQILFSTGVQIHPLFFYGSITGFLLTFALYPAKNRSESFSKRYRRQKTVDGLLAISTFLMLVCLSNQTWTSTKAANAWMPKRISTIEIKSDAPSVAIPPAKIIHKKTEKKQWVNRIMDFLNASKAYTSGEKAIFTILAILGAAVLLYLVAALACNISCNGAEGAAIAVAVVGVGAIIFFFVKFMKHLNRNPSVSRKKKPSSTNSE